MGEPAFKIRAENPQQSERPETHDPKKDRSDDDGKQSAATLLIEIAQERFTLGMSTDGDAYAVPVRGPKIVATLRGNRGSLRGQLARIYFQRFGRAAPQQALADALLVMDGMAQEVEPQPLYLRVANLDNVTWLDIGDTTGRAIRIAEDGWTVEDSSPVLFKRTALNSALPDPEPGALDDIWQFMNVAEADRPLLAAWLVSVLHDDIAHPVLSFFGEQGTGKTTAQRLLVDLIDPSPVPTRKPPRDAESWVTAAAGSWVVGMDNLSDVKPWLSDSICRAVTGDGDVRRKLYTDGDHAVFAYRRCIILNSIDLGATRGDLAERMLPIHLETISEKSRVGDRDIWPKWYACRARVLGGLLDLAARYASHARQDSHHRLETLPRMADFAKVLAGIDAILGTDGLQHFFHKQRALATDGLSSDPLIAALDSALFDIFQGTASELLARVTPDKPPKGWPASPRIATQLLHRHAPSLRKAGWAVDDDGGNNHRNATIWTLDPPSRPEMSRIPSSPDSQARGYTPKRESASYASMKYGQSQDGCQTFTGPSWADETEEDV